MPAGRSSRYRWDAGAGRYRDAASGRFVSQVAVRQALDQVIAHAYDEMRALAEGYRMGNLPLDTWQAEMRELIKELHLDAAAAVRGGWDQMTQADYGRVGQIVRDQYRYLAAFTRDLRNGYPLDGRFLSRMTLYADAARAMYHAELLAVMEEAGYDEERSVLGIAEHCDACVEEDAKGWAPIGTLVQIGDRTCLTRCKCHMEYRRSQSSRSAA